MMKYGRGYIKNGAVRAAANYGGNNAKPNTNTNTNTNSNSNSNSNMNMMPALVENLEGAVMMNENFRTIKWNGKNMLLTEMNIPVGGEIGGEIHNGSDQLLYIIRGNGMALIGNGENSLDIKQNIAPGYAVIIPDGKWHNIQNIGDTPLKLFSVYAGNEMK